MFPKRSIRDLNIFVYLRNYDKNKKKKNRRRRVNERYNGG